jgi:hypothetical protein
MYLRRDLLFLLLFLRICERGLLSFSMKVAILDKEAHVQARLRESIDT